MNDQMNAYQGTGIPSLDHVLTGLQPGDNVVLQVDGIADYIPFVHTFARDARRNGRKLIYFRFAGHQHLLPADVQAITHELNPATGFEAFISVILSVIEAHNVGACYVFDSLSDLAADWYSDIMLGNFFQLACPYLYQFETYAYFAILRNRHASQVIEAIQNTAQVIIDVYRKDTRVFLHPIKVFKRHSPTMYMLHELHEQNLVPITRSSDVSGFFSKIRHPWLDLAETRVDTWRVALLHASSILDRTRAGLISQEEIENARYKLLRMFIAREKRLFDLAAEYLDLEGLLAIGRRMIGTGLIGGKAVGMLIAQAILQNGTNQLASRLEQQDSFFIGSDVYYTYLVNNKAWWGRRRLSNPETFLEGMEETKLRILEGKFPRYIIEKFSQVLEYFGQNPIIVRSSSLLEDAFGNAFSGKYMSVFCPNQGTPEERLANFVNAVKSIYASTINENALVYRRTRGLLDKDEQMALLVMRVSGDVHGKYFFPQIAGVGYSFNPYAWRKGIDPKAGFLRLVLGLGTRAVDRKDDYTRLVALNAPLERLIDNEAGIRKYSQRRVDMLNLDDNTFISPMFYKISGQITKNLPMHLFVREGDIIALDGMLSKTTFAADMQLILKTLEVAYMNPVDIEFTVNFATESSYMINVLQCRPFQIKRDTIPVNAPASIPDEMVILKTEGPIIGTSIATVLDLVVYIEKQGSQDRDHRPWPVGNDHAISRDSRVVFGDQQRFDHRGTRRDARGPRS
jgi:pyruvate,water dikinase